MRSFNLLFALLTIVNTLVCQNMTTLPEEKFTVAFYNVENFFDTIADSTSDYSSFNPSGELGWDNYKFSRKRNSIYKVITALNGWDRLVLLGLAEIESKAVLNELLYRTPLSHKNLNYCHFDSPDARGIDVALVYNTLLVEIDSCTNYVVRDPSDNSFKTRDILYVKCRLLGSEMHVFVVHFTSRYRGLMESEYLRVISSNRLTNLIDSLKSECQNPNILVMGDFNDEFKDKSIQNLISESELAYLSSSSVFNNADGTLKYQNRWYKFDHILVSNSLLDGNSGLVSDTMAFIYDNNFLLENDEKYNGVKPRRNYIGFRYNGGYSDHLPLFLHIYRQNIEHNMPK